MPSEITSYFGKPAEGIPIRQGAPIIPRPTKEEVDLFPKEAKSILNGNRSAQNSFIQKNKFDLNWMKGKHFVLAGATGPGLGGALATAVLNLVGDSGGVTIISRDLSKSVGYETGKQMEETAANSGFENRFHWLNSGLALEGGKLDIILSALKEAKAEKVIYINTVAAASSGLLPGFPPVFVKDADENGLYQWELTPLNDQSVETTSFVMGTMAVQFSHVLMEAGIEVEATAFSDWRGSLDVEGRNPQSDNYGRWGPYSTSLYLPKEILRREIRAAYGTKRVVLDCFFPVMKTRALGFIPGGHTLSSVYDRFMEVYGVRFIDIPELALGMLDKIGIALNQSDFNPFNRLDVHELAFDLWFFEIVRQLNNDENSDFHYKKWISVE